MVSQTNRDTVPAMEELIGQKFPVLSDGFVYVVDYMGSDAAVVQMARTSYGAGTKTVNEDRGLIRYLMRHKHTTPFEGCELKLHIRLPMDAMRQWIRHRTANVNEYSTRYSIAIDSKDKTASDGWRLQSELNKQGSGDGALAFPNGFNFPGYLADDRRHEVAGDYLSSRETALHDFAKEIYEERLAFGVAREQARKDLPLSTYTECYWKIDLHNLLHFLSLRMDSHAQKEIRDYATIIGEQIVAKWVPLVWEAFQDYRLNSITLSGPEMKIVRDSVLAIGGFGVSGETMQKYGVAKVVDGNIKPTREGEELTAKLRKMFVEDPS